MADGKSGSVEPSSNTFGAFAFILREIIIEGNDMDDDDFGADEEFLAALAAVPQPQPSAPVGQRPYQLAPKVQQPTPQRLDKPPQSNAAASATSASSGQQPPKVIQPKPQNLPSRSSGSTILVSPRQKGNPVLTCLKSVPWEYSDILADYQLGLTTCALFLRCVPYSLIS